ncbi:sensor histidine kinase [Sutcliffiella halmapala]|uniref:sensor histidine kinase n=1 Tax=Sutcliffiella halmapala TaxID=79882 RepID=UPI000994F414|nr:ATP-binding protein [Sutcliffiella halmapala]
MKSLSIRQKIWISIISVSTFTIVIVVALSYYLYETLYIEKQLKMLMLQGQELEQSFHQDGSTVFLQKVEWLKESSESEIIFTDDPMLLASGAPFDSFSDENLITFSERQELLQGKTISFSRIHKGLNQEVLAVVVPLKEHERLAGAVFLYLPLTAITEAFQPIRMILFGGLVIIVFLLFLVGMKITNELVKPIKEMDLVAGKMAEGDFAKRVAVVGKDELSNLASSINTLSASLDEVEQKRREFLGNVSHELRTPISYLKGYSEAIVEGIVDHKKYAEIIYKESDRMNRLVHDLLDLAELEGDTYPINQEPVIVSEVIHDVVERFELKLAEKQISIETELDEAIIVKGDRDRIDQVLTNLISNAIRYSLEQKEIRMTLKQQKDKAIFIIQDQGVGIPEKDLSHIFERFYRVNKARTRQDGGTGLGLSIVQQIVKKHEGEVKIESVESKGTTVTITLPIFSL